MVSVLRVSDGVLVRALATGLFMAAAASCTADPTDDANFSNVVLRNDTSHEFNLAVCDTGGTGCHSLGQFPARSDYEQRVDCCGSPISYRLDQVGRSGQAMWINISTKGKRDGRVFRVSQAVLDPEQLSTSDE
jgi:hypothetical protein